MATYYDPGTGLTHLLETTIGELGDRHWLYCAHPLARTPSDQVFGVPVRCSDAPATRPAMVVTCLWCLCGRRRS